MIRMSFLISAMWWAVALAAQPFESDVVVESMGGAGVALGGSSAILANPAGLASTSETWLWAGASNRYLIGELTRANGGGMKAMGGGMSAMAISAFGFDTWQELGIRLAHARSLAPGFRAAVHFDYFQTRISHYGQFARLSGGFGLQADVNQRLTVGAQVLHPARLRLDEGESLSTSMAIGLAYRPHASVELVSQVDKRIGWPARWRAGIAWQAASSLILRAGFSSDPAMVSGGLGLQLRKGLLLDMGFSWHQALGLSPGVQLRWKVG